MSQIKTKFLQFDSMKYHANDLYKGTNKSKTNI